MSISEIKQNVDKLKTLDKETLISYIDELLIYEKRQDSKSISLKTEIKYLNRHLKKIRDLIDKILKSKIKDETDEETWKK